MRVLTINCGSSSIKFKLFDMTDNAVLAAGIVERIGEAAGAFRCTRHGHDEEVQENGAYTDHRHAMRRIVVALAPLGLPDAIGHRIVHGGASFDRAVWLEPAIVARIRELIPLAPLHNPVGLQGIEAAQAAWPGIAQAVVFDTAFHQTLPETAWRYALPDALYTQHQVRRYGFHGTSHHFVAGQAAALMGRPLAGLNLITLHLGHGASAAAIRDGRSVETSMGMTPLEGLMMGTRCGDLDPAVPEYLVRTTGRTAAEVDHLLNHESGLKGICGVHDMREVHRQADAGDARAQLAFDMFCHRLRKYIGAYTAVLGRVDALVFTGGIGEHDARTRAAACAGLEEAFGLAIDAAANAANDGTLAAIHAHDSRTAILVVPTDEELAIARQTVALLENAQYAMHHPQEVEHE